MSIIAQHGQPARKTLQVKEMEQTYGAVLTVMVEVICVGDPLPKHAPVPNAFWHLYKIELPDSVHIAKSLIVIPVHGTAAGQITLMGARDTPFVDVPRQLLKLRFVYDMPFPATAVLQKC